MGNPWWYILYNVLIWAFCMYFSFKRMNNREEKNRHYSKNNKRGIVLLFVLFLLYSLFIFYGGDNARYENFVTSNGTTSEPELGGIDPLYAVLANMTAGNFVLWKLIVYGTALLLTFWALKRLNALNYLALFAFTTFCLSSYGATRGVLACSILVLAISFITDRSIILKAAGVLLAVFSISAHSSMILPVLLLPLSLVKLDNRKIVILLIMFPVLLSFYNALYPALFSNESLMDMQTGYKLQTYTDETENVGSGSSLLMSLHLFLDYIVIIMSLFYSLKADNKGVLPKTVSFLVRCSFLLFYVAMLINFSNMPGGDFISTRYMTLIPFFLFITWPFIINNKVVFTRGKQNLYFNVSVINIAFLFLMMTFYTYMGR